MAGVSSGGDVRHADLEPLAALAARMCQTSMAWIDIVGWCPDLADQPPEAALGGQLWDLLRDPAAVDPSAARSSAGDPTAVDPPAPVVVPDAREDPRVARHPAVSGAPGVRFYAAVPLVAADGGWLGTLAVADTRPGELDFPRLPELTMLAAEVVNRLGLQRRLTALADQLTERESELAASKKNEQLLDGILENTDVLIYAKDLDGRFVLANPALRHSIGNNDGEIVGRSDHELMSAESADLFRDNDAQIGQGGTRQFFTESRQLPDGTVRRYRSTKFPLRDADDQVYAIAGVSTDVTELIATRSALEDSEQRWRALVEHSLGAVAVIGTGGSFAYANPQAIRLLGVVDLGQLIGRSALDFVPVDAHPTAVRRFGPLLRGAPPVVGVRGILRRDDGSVVDIEINAAHVLHDRQPAVQLELRDVSAQTAAENALRMSERRFRAVFDQSPFALSLSDERGRWVVANAAFGTLLGVDPQSLVGQSADAFAHPDDRPLIAASEQGQRDSPDGVLRMELRFVRPTGEQRWAWTSVTPTPGPNGEQWTLGIAVDITDRKASETALRDSEENLAAIAAVARCVQSGADPRSVVVTSVRSLAGATTVSMLECAQPGTLTVTASEGIDLVGFVISMAVPSVTAHVWRTGEPMFIADAADNPMVNPAWLALSPTASMLWQPVVVEGDVIGILVVTWRHRMADIGDRVMRAVELLADEAGASLHAAQLRAELVRSAATDPLTGALNRRAWEAELAVLMQQARASGSPMTVALIDLDDFKAYNDAFGHMAGDVVLRDFAARAREQLRRGDLFARWGGEEFIAALPDASAASAGDILQRLRVSVPAGLTCSIGHTRWDGREPINACVGRADAALYDAKHNGRNQITTR